MIARTDGRNPPAEGSTVSVVPKPERLHVFDTQSGERLVA